MGYDKKKMMTGVLASWQRAQHRPWETWIGSIQMSPNCWYIGDTWVGVILIRSTEGLILIDSGMTGQVPFIFEAIRDLGMRPKDIKYILISHGHFDHVGGLNAIRRYTGAKVGAPKEDLAALEGDESLLRSRGEFYLPETPDFFYDDAVPIRLGTIEIHTMHTPGHTAGTTSFFFEDADDNQCLRVGIFGGLGLGTLFPDDPDSDLTPYYLQRRAYRISMGRLIHENVDITASVHPAAIGCCDKISEVRNGHNPYIDSRVWTDTIRKYIHQLDIAEDK